MKLKTIKYYSLSILYRTNLMTKLLISYLILIILPLGLFSILSYKTVSKELSEKTAFSSKQSFEQTYYYLSYKLNNISNTALQIAVNKDLRSIISKSPNSYEQDPILLTNDSKFLSTYLSEKENSDNIIRTRLYVNDGLSFSSNRQNIFSLNAIKDSIWKKKLLDNRSNSIWIPTADLYGDDTYIAQSDIKTKDTLSLGVKIPVLNNYNVSAGILRCDFSKKSFTEILSNENIVKNSISCLVDENNNLIAASPVQVDKAYFPNTSKISYYNTDWSYKKVDNKTLLVGSRKIINSDWCLINIIPYNEITYESHKIFRYLTILIGVILTIAYFMAFMFSKSITKRVSELANKMTNVRGGKLSPMNPSKFRDEIGILIDDYNYMTKEMSELIEYRYKAGKDLKNAELKLLQAQINPHFLYNTLDMINWYGKKNNSPEILSIVNSLTQFYRISLSGGQDTITIENELKHIRSYFTIQNLRFENKLNLIINVPKEMLSYHILKITLQPIVENAILHGIMNKESKSGTIIISGMLKNNIITLTVVDDGIGMSLEKLESITLGVILPRHGGFGINNVKERIKLYYGDDSSITYESKEGKGTVVQIRFLVKP